MCPWLPTRSNDRAAGALTAATDSFDGVAEAGIAGLPLRRHPRQDWDGLVDVVIDHDLALTPSAGGRTVPCAAAGPGPGDVYKILATRLYLGQAVHKGTAYPGEHATIVDQELCRWRPLSTSARTGRIRP